MNSIETIYPKTIMSVVKADVSNEASVTPAFQNIKLTLGLVDFLIFNAGYLPDIQSVADISVDNGHEINVKGTFIVAKTVAILAEDARVINFTSVIATLLYVPGNSSYATSKIASTKLFEYL
ncbi:hypothetical protein B0O99DRAFT_693325 [Bisporella sp. PMI_857]|nr:hypothetical protein B0O99DRAFT_693325 [Bisporella sp. PMI_857]